MDCTVKPCVAVVSIDTAALAKIAQEVYGLRNQRDIAEWVHNQWVAVAHYMSDLSPDDFVITEAAHVQFVEVNGIRHKFTMVSAVAIKCPYDDSRLCQLDETCNGCDKYQKVLRMAAGLGGDKDSGDGVG